MKLPRFWTNLPWRLWREPFRLLAHHRWPDRAYRARLLARARRLPTDNRNGRVLAGALRRLAALNKNRSHRCS